MTIRSHLRRCFLVTALLLATGAAHGLSIAPPDWWFQRVGLPTDQASLVRYLFEGFPPGLKPVIEPYRGSKIPLDRWPQYDSAIYMLEKTPEANTALRRLMESPLPEPLMEDLLLFVAFDWQNWESYDDWDRRAATEAAELQARGALKLAQNEGKIAEPALLSFVDRAQPQVEAALQNPREGATLASLYALICSELAQMGRREGVDALVSLLAATPYSAGGHGNALFSLRRLFGPKFPSTSDTEAQYREAVRQWQEWWAANRDSFEAPGEPWTPPAPEKLYTYPPPEGSSKYERALAYAGAYADTDFYAGPAPELKEWLEENAESHGRMLRRIADDETLPDKIRWAAAQWYVKGSGDRAMKWVRGQVMEWSPEDKPGAPFDPSRLLQMTREETRSAHEVVEIAKECVEERCAATPAAAHILLSYEPDARDPQFVLDRYERIVESFPEVRRAAASHFFANPAPGDEKVFLDVLRSGDRSAAAFAVAAVKRRGLADKLPADARESYDKWAENQSVRFEVINLIQNPEQREKAALELVRAVDGTDAEAARVYAFGYLTLTRHGNAEITPEAQSCLDALHRCIDAYLERRADAP